MTAVERARAALDIWPVKCDVGVRLMVALRDLLALTRRYGAVAHA